MIFLYILFENKRIWYINEKKRFYRNFDFIIYNTINIEIDVICIYCFLNGCMILIYLQIANPYF